MTKTIIVVVWSNGPVWIEVVANDWDQALLRLWSPKPITIAVQYAPLVITILTPARSVVCGLNLIRVERLQP